jgi:hypothetical protein
MMQTWGGWKRFPDVKGGDVVEAPAGPGVYEVRHMLTGRVVAFGHSGDVAHTIAGLKFDGDGGPIANFFRKPPLVSRIADLEYRTCAAPRPRPPRNGCSACGRPPGAGAWTWVGQRVIQANQRKRIADRLAPAHGLGLGRPPSELNLAHDPEKWEPVFG